MPAYYDQYDYPQFWEGREYEHSSEVIAIQKFLNKIPQINRLIDLGAGYGRLTPYYLYRAKRSVLIDSSAKLLRQARMRVNALDSKRASHVRYVQIRAQKVSKKVKNGTFDLVLCIRILHYIENPAVAFNIINKLLQTNGYIILEFPNKLHGKARARRMIKKGETSLVNFDPHLIERVLKEQGFDIIEKRSVSNIRSPFLKKYLPLQMLLFVEELLQNPLSSMYFGPSIFILARKRG